MSSTRRRNRGGRPRVGFDDTTSRAERLREVANQYFALKAPVVLPSGKVNTWILRVYTAQTVHVAGLSDKNQDSSTRLAAAPERIILTLYDIPKDATTLQEDASLQFLSDDLLPMNNPHNREQAPKTAQERAMRDLPAEQVCDNKEILPTSIRITIACLEAIFYHFCNITKHARVALSEAEQPLLDVIPPLGSFRPQCIYFNDIGLLDMINSTLYSILGDFDMLRGSDVALFLKQPSPGTKDTSVRQMLVFCNQCRAAGVDRDGSSGRKKMLRCGRCLTTW